MKNKIKVFVSDGIVHGVFSDSEAEVEIIYGDKDANDFYDYVEAWDNEARRSREKLVSRVY